MSDSIRDLAQMMSSHLDSAETSERFCVELTRFTNITEQLVFIIREIISSTDRVDAATIASDIARELREHVNRGQKTLSDMLAEEADTEDGRAPKLEIFGCIV